MLTSICIDRTCGFLSVGVAISSEGVGDTNLSIVKLSALIIDVGNTDAVVNVVLICVARAVGRATAEPLAGLLSGLAIFLSVVLMLANAARIERISSLI
ncbi:hypothetical protein [Nitrosomonas communis]|uniref:hypothetical protein n=1 Tax=Nitrosomonas communis TaxID=44574 RepID=UPI0026F21080|nr:hypothetical protein [Nitrosomonas communis]MCO6427133.1 hypothetical protein [Nitrosomonas communis]